MKQAYILTFIFIFCVLCTTAQNKEKFTPANAESFLFKGRVQLKNEKAAFNWPGVSVETTFTGKKLGIKINGGDKNFFNVYVDKNPVWILHAPVDSIYFYPEKLKGGPHQLKIVKRTEADLGMATFYGIQTAKGTTVKNNADYSERKMLFIGNSITCGYGTEGKDKNEHFSPDTEDCEDAYATILARAFNADYQLVSHSGIGMVRNYGAKEKVSSWPMPARIDYLFDNDSTQKWDLSGYVPDAIVINLGTNDFSTKPHPDEEVFKQAYKNLIRRLQTLYPKAQFFCITGPMINEPCYSFVKSVTEEMYSKKIPAYFIGVPNHLLNKTDDLGSDWHPSGKGQLKSANHMVNIISNIMGWNYSKEQLN